VYLITHPVISPTVLILILRMEFASQFFLQVTYYFCTLLEYRVFGFRFWISVLLRRSILESESMNIRIYADAKLLTCFPPGLLPLPSECSTCSSVASSNWTLTGLRTLVEILPEGNRWGTISCFIRSMNSFSSSRVEIEVGPVFGLSVSRRYRS